MTDVKAADNITAFFAKRGSQEKEMRAEEKPASASPSKLERDILDVKLALMRIDSRLEKLPTREDYRRRFEELDRDLAKIRGQLGMVEVDALAKPNRATVIALTVVTVGIIASASALALAISQNL